MKEQMVNAELEPGLSLTGLDKGDRLEEMEFHFPLAEGSLSELVSCCNWLDPSPMPWWIE